MTSDKSELRAALEHLDQRIADEYRRLAGYGIDPAVAADRARRMYHAQRETVLDALVALHRTQPTSMVVSLEEFRKLRAFHPSELSARLKAAVRDARMAPGHEHLNRLMEDEG